jgi:uncharacterized SAM-binding protein YcdF (DUF218 family)
MYQLVVDLMRPFVLLHLTCAVALVLLWRKRREGRRPLAALTAAFVLLALACLPATAYYALGTLEDPYPPLERRPDDAGAIVVLSGSLHQFHARTTHVELGADSLYRCIRTAELYRAGPPCPVVVSGGKADGDPGPTLASAMRDFLVTQGVRPEDLVLEERSRTTYENAAECARLLGARGVGRVVLVTDATHLMRAEGCFHRQGLDVVPCGCRYRAYRWTGSAADYLPDPAAAAGLQAAWHEWLGVVWYRLLGRM